MAEERNQLANTLIGACVMLANAGMEQTINIADIAANSLSAASTIMIIGLVAALVVGVVLAFSITRGITRAIRRVATGLSESAEQVASA